MTAYSSSEYIVAFILAFALAAILTPFARRFALRRRIVDVPGVPRKIHTAPVPLLGGWAVGLSFLFVLALFFFWRGGFLGEHISAHYVFGMAIATLVLMIGGYLDDRHSFKPRQSVIAPLIAVIVVMVSGVTLSYINHPLGGALSLDSYKVAGYPVWGGVFVFVWLLGMMYTTKFLDGMDGLVSGTVGMGGVVLFALSLIPVVDQPDTALLSIIFAGSMLGFLPYNFHPAKIFLGESGSTFAGFMLGLLAVISGGKIATALLIMGIPILDVVWVILRRLVYGDSPFRGDRKHLHFRLLDVGFSQRQAVLLLYALSVAFGASGLYLQSAGKLAALFVLFIVMVLLGAGLVIAYQRKKHEG